MTEELAIIKHIDIGLRDVGKPVIWFETSGLHGSALQVISDIEQFIIDAKCKSLSDLEGKPCVVEEDGMFVRFVRVFK